MDGYGTAARGFSLAELLVTIGIVAILAAIALPSFHSTINASRVNGLATLLYRDLKVAQAEAIRRGTPIGLYAKGTTPDWVNGWYVSDSSGGTALVDRAAPDEGYLVTASTSSGIPASLTPVTSVVFKQMGSVPDTASGITFLACERNNNASSRQQVAVKASGSVLAATLDRGATTDAGCGS